MQQTILKETQKGNKSNMRNKSITALMGMWIAS